MPDKWSISTWDQKEGGEEIARQEKAKSIEGQVTSTKKAKLEQREQEEETSEESCEDGEASLYPSEEGDNEDDDDDRSLEAELDFEADLDEMSEFADTDEEDEEMRDHQKWSDYYMSADRNRNVREHFLSTFFKYLKKQAFFLTLKMT